MKIARVDSGSIGRVFVLLLLSIRIARADNVVINFDNLATDGGSTLYAGNTFTLSGITFTSGSIATPSMSATQLR